MADKNYYVIQYCTKSQYRLRSFCGNEKCRNEVLEQYNKNGTIFIPEKRKDVAIKNLIISRIEVMRGISLLPSIDAENWKEVIDDWEELTIEDWKEIG